MTPSHLMSFPVWDPDQIGYYWQVATEGQFDEGPNPIKLPFRKHMALSHLLVCMDSPLKNNS